MLYEIVHDFPNGIIFDDKGPFISLYQRTHRHKPENRQDLIRFDNLVSRIRDSLERDYPKVDVEKLLEPFDQIYKDRIFWNKSTDGLAIIANPNKCVVYRLPRGTGDVAIVANSPYIKPLLRNYQSADKYNVLGLEQRNFMLFEGDRYGFEKVEFPEGDDITKEEVLGDQYSEPHLTPRVGNRGPANAPVFHGHGGRKDELEKDTDKYFRYIDNYIFNNYSNDSKAPLILATLDEHFGLFKDISDNPHLVDEGIRKDFRSLSLTELKNEAWNLVEPVYLQKTEDLTDRYNLQRNKFLASHDLAEVARAAVDNRVDTIMVEADRIIAGAVNKETGEIEAGDLDDPKVGDLLNAISLVVLKNKGEVVVLPKDRMPSETGLAAIFRY